MTAKEYLNQARWLDQQIQAKLLRYEQMRVLVEKCTASSGTGGGGSRDVHSLEKSICKLIDFGRELDEEIDLLITKRKEIDNVIQSVPDYKQRMVLEYRYQCELPFSAIAKRMKLTKRYVLMLHDQALHFVQNQYALMLHDQALNFCTKSSGLL